ncbi:MAG: hypothetical protein IPL79_08845 [Myxococcales bacterium]|nr:hypothetical protein [Myxococcales bacterium]
MTAMHAPARAAMLVPPTLVRVMVDGVSIEIEVPATRKAWLVHARRLRQPKAYAKRSHAKSRAMPLCSGYAPH